MKWLFLLLLIINLGILAWGYQQEQMEPETPIAAGSDVGNMRLISEVEEEPKPAETAPTLELVEAASAQEQEQEQEPEVAVVTPEPVQSAPEQKTEVAAVKPEPAESVPAQEPEVAAAKPEHEAGLELAEPPGMAAADTTPAEQSEPEEVQTKEVIEVESVLQQQVGTATSTETEPSPEQYTSPAITDTTQPVLERPIADGKPAPPKPEIISKCGVIGPLKDKQEAKEVLDDLIKSKVTAKLEQSTEQLQIGFWVVIPALTDGGQVQAKIEELAKVGLKDIWHFRGGTLKNSISLGMFSKRENAENYSRQVLKKGFKTKVQPRYLNKTRYLIKFSISKPKTAARMMWKMVENKYSKMPFSEQSCEPIATR